MNIKTIIISTLLIFFVTLPSSATVPAYGFEELIDKVLPSVVTISVSKTRNHPITGKEQEGTSAGSGFVIDPRGYIVTNYHVIKGEDVTVKVKFSNGEEYEVEIAGTDPKTDLAVLKMKVGRPIPYVEWANSDDARMGQLVLALGNPFNLGFSASVGIVSGDSRDIGMGPYDDFIQTDATINKGNSGGPLFTMDGKVLGVNSVIFGGNNGGSVGVGFAIPASMAKAVTDQLIKNGKVVRAWMGIRIRPVTKDVAEAMNLPGKPRGALIVSLTSRSPALAAGLKQGDIILKFNDIYIKKMRDLPKIVAFSSVGTIAKIMVWRKSNEPDPLRRFQMQLEELPTDLARLNELAESDTMEVHGLSLAMNDDTPGVIIKSIGEGSLGEESGLLENDIIVKVTQLPAVSPAQVIRLIQKAENEGKDFVMLLIEREGNRSYVALKLK